MAEFGGTQAPELQSFETVKEGVVKQPVLLEGLTDIFTDFTKSLSDSRKTGVVAQFTAQQLKFAEAVAQGKKSAWGRTQMRTNLLQTIQSNPGLTAELLAAQSSVVNTSGAGLVVKEGIDEEQRIRAKHDSLVDGGLLKTNATEEEFQQAAVNERIAKAAELRYTEQIKTLDLQSKAIGLETAQISLINQQKRSLAENYLRDVAPSELDKFTVEMDNILSALGTEGVTGATVTVALEETWINFQQSVSQATGDADNDVAKALMKPFELRYELSKKIALGTIDQASIDTEIKRIQTLTLLSALTQNPAFARTMAISNIYTNVPPQLLGKITNLGAEFINAGISADDELGLVPLTVKKEKEKALKDYFEMIGSLDTDKKEDQAELKEHMSSIFLGLENAETILTKNPESAIELVNWMSSQQFLKFRNEFKDDIDFGVATDVLKAGYYDELSGMVAREFTKANIKEQLAVAQGPPGINPSISTTRPTPPTVVIPEQPVAGAVSYETNANGIVFKPINPKDKIAREEAKKLNSSLASAINSSIKAFAHMDGRTDYQKYADELITDSGIFTTGGEGEGGGGGDGDPDLALDAFTKPVDMIEGEHERVSRTASFLATDVGLSPVQVAGVLGNFVVESGSKDLNTAAIGDGGNARGIAQWNGPRKKALENFAKAANMDVNDLELQLMFLLQELETTEKSAFRKLKAAKTVEEAAEIFSLAFERPGTPHLARRKSEAVRIAKSMGLIETQAPKTSPRPKPRKK